MKAYIRKKYGSPENIVIKEVELPSLQDNEVKIKIYSASVNQTDVEAIKGWFFVRIGQGLRKPNNKILGCDYAGKIEEIGKKVTQFKPGDEVYGDLMANRYYGAFAEYVILPERLVRIKPSIMTMDQASTIGQAGVLALQGIIGKKELKQGQKILINGAGGGVGTFAVQIAKIYGLEITAVDKEEKFTLLKELGATNLIDYTKDDFTKKGKRYDLILDVVAKKSVFAYRRALTKTGVYRMVGGTTGRIFQVIFLGGLISKVSTKKVGPLIGKPNNKEYMEQITKLFMEKKVKPIIDKVFNFEQVPEAIKYIANGDVKG